MKFLLVGLGNIGKEYENTRHNIGFKILDKLTKDNSVTFELDRLAFVANFRYKSHQIVAIKPTTYMNLSGKALNYWMQKEKISIDTILAYFQQFDNLKQHLIKMEFMKSYSDKKINFYEYYRTNTAGEVVEMNNKSSEVIK